MGNEASMAVTAATAKAKLNSTMGQIDQKLQGQPKQENLVGTKNRKEAEKRRREREKEYAMKKEERTQRKTALSEQWAAHRMKNNETSNK